MRRLAVVCAGGGNDLPRRSSQIGKNSGAFAAGRQSAAFPLSGLVPASFPVIKVSVFAANVAVRALAVSRPPGRPLPPSCQRIGAPTRYSPWAATPTPSTPSASVRIAALAGTGVAGSLGDGGAATAAEFDLNVSSLFERSGIAIAARRHHRTLPTPATLPFAPSRDHPAPSPA